MRVNEIYGYLFLTMGPLRMRVDGGLLKMKIDVCCVTKNDPSRAWMRNLELLPTNNLIVEKSVPLVKARAKAIEKVETDWLLFLDDDVYLTSEWWPQACSYIEPGVGAVQGREQIYGMGKKVEPEINRYRRQFPSRSLSLGMRGTTVDTLIRTEVVRDWKPTEELCAFEDYLLTQHILRKGFKFLDVNLPCWHTRTWSKNWVATVRDMKALKRLYDGKRQGCVMAHYVKALTAWSLQFVFDWRPKFTYRRARGFLVFQDLAAIYGLITQ